MKKVVVIVGPTASGKTKQSICLAKAINGEVINGDSVQVYEELNIGSAKIKEEEKENIEHHLFSIKKVGEAYSAYNFQQDVRSLIDKIDYPIIVGGTGFYIKSALYNYEFTAEEDFDYSNYNHLTKEELYSKVIENDLSSNVDKNNRHRLVRALYLSEQGEKRSSKNKKDEPLYDVLVFYLDVNRDKLKDILTSRLNLMLKEGFLEEVKMLKAKGLTLNIIGYRELDLYLDGKINLDEAKEEIIKASMRLAKKQKTWFKNQMKSVMIDAYSLSATELIINQTKEFLNKL